ncbi:hypothetical protein SNEBB_011016 [Seison nebaliae]|nr:hypothetical protein SNEBB_011016 [Seison nebaliae]
MKPNKNKRSFKSTTPTDSPTRKSTRKRRRILNSEQRYEATIREKTRMRKLNTTFEQLRNILPEFFFANCSKHRLSRAETLKLAIDYIGYMRHLIRHCDSCFTCLVGNGEQCEEVHQLTLFFFPQTSPRTNFLPLTPTTFLQPSETLHTPESDSDQCSFDFYQYFNSHQYHHYEQQQYTDNFLEH